MRAASRCTNSERSVPKWTFSTLRGNRGYTKMTPVPTSGAPAGDANARTAEGGCGADCRAMWCCVRPMCWIPLAVCLALVVLGAMLLTTGLFGCFDPLTKGCVRADTVSPPPSLPPALDATRVSLFAPPRNVGNHHHHHNGSVAASVAT